MIWAMRHGLGACLLVIACAGCTDVVIIPNDGGGPSSGGSSPIGGFDGSGGFDGGGFDSSGGAVPIAGGPAGGSPSPGPVPGCEALELVGEPILLPNEDAPPWDWNASLVTLDGDRAGLVYMSSGYGSDGEVRTRTIDGAFSSWPPTINDSLVVYEGFIGDVPLVLSALPSGLFSLSLGAPGIYAFDAPGAVREAEMGWSSVFVYPEAGTPFDVVSYDDIAGHQLHGFPSLDAPSETVGQTFAVESCGRVTMATGPSGTLLSAGTSSFCGQSPQVELFKKGPGGLVLAATLPLAAHPSEERLAARPGGYWYFMANWDGQTGTYAYALDEDGVPVGEPWHDPYFFGDFTPHLRAWRDGFVGGHRAEGGILSIFVSDGFNRTDMAPILDIDPMQSIASKTELAVAVGGPDSGSFLMAYPTMSGILLARAECVTPFK
jgi:hypothetical protein